MGDEAKLLMDRIDAAITRITSGQAPMRIPRDLTDPDVVLADCQDRIAALEAQNAELERQWKLRAECENCGYIGEGLKHCPACDHFIPLNLAALQDQPLSEG